ncbi:MAG: hypothetical protein U1F34_09910 [Gammaproteobacteria bacterium]
MTNDIAQLGLQPKLKKPPKSIPSVSSQHRFQRLYAVNAMDGQRLETTNPSRFVVSESRQEIRLPSVGSGVES